MIGLGTLLNAAGIVAGGLIGVLFRQRLTRTLQENLVRALGLVCLFIGISGTMEKALSVADGGLHAGGTFMVIASFVIGTVIGTWLGIDAAMRRLGEFLKQRFGGKDDARFVQAFVVTSLTVCIGAMAVVGSIEDGISGNYSILAAKSVMDLVITAAFAASMGRGCLFAALPVAVFQGLITVLARGIGPYLTPEAIANIGYTGAMMIFCVGVNLIWDEKFKVADMLPGLIVAAAWAYFA